MLVLTLKPGQRVEIGKDVVVHVTRCPVGGKTKLGIEAPRTTPIVRGELIDRDKREELRAG